MKILSLCKESQSSSSKDKRAKLLRQVILMDALWSISIHLAMESSVSTLQQVLQRVMMAESSLFQFEKCQEHKYCHKGWNFGTQLLNEYCQFSILNWDVVVITHGQQRLLLCKCLRLWEKSCCCSHYSTLILLETIVQLCQLSIKDIVPDVC